MHSLAILGTKKPILWLYSASDSHSCSGYTWHQKTYFLAILGIKQPILWLYLASDKPFPGYTWHQTTHSLLHFSIGQCILWLYLALKNPFSGYTRHQTHTLALAILGIKKPIFWLYLASNNQFSGYAWLQTNHSLAILGIRLTHYDLCSSFNKKEEDFSSLRDYNDYLEMIETIVFNLTNGIDVESTRKMIEQYRKDNKDQIKKNLSKMSKDQEYLDQLIEQEKHDTAVRKQMIEEEAARDKAFKKKNKAALIDELMFSDLSATDIVATHRECVNQLEAASRASAPTTFSTGIKIGHHDTVLPLPGCEDNGDAYMYLPYDLNNSGPSLIDQEAIHNLG
ncbi:CDK-activating kinase assembly factor MAT1-like isoform X1 [Haliotis rubra]|nr:CDK-activating kinase assembly factor MAT1-like isoform X1 [Haliotis rubra]